MEFTLTKSSHRNRVDMQGLPIGEQGEYTLRLSLRTADSDLWSDLADYPVQISQSPAGLP